MASRIADCSIANTSQLNFSNATATTINLNLVRLLKVDRTLQTAVCRHQGSKSRDAFCGAGVFSFNNEVAGLYNTAILLRKNPSQQALKDLFNEDTAQVTLYVGTFYTKACYA